MLNILLLFKMEEVEEAIASDTEIYMKLLRLLKTEVLRGTAAAPVSSHGLNV